MKICNDIYKLTLDKFITCICDSDLSVLIIEGKPTEKELQEAWNKIYNDYLQASADKEQLKIFNLNKEIGLLELRYNAIILAIRALGIDYSADLVNFLKTELNVNAAFDINNKEQYARDLQLAITKSKKLLLDIERKRKELDEQLPEKAGKITRKYFDQKLTQLSKHIGVYVNPSETTVSRFIIMVLDMHEYWDKLKEKHNAK